jgi:transposase
MQFETIIRARTPRCECPAHGVATVAVPWADPHGRFTLLFEAFAVRLLQACASVEAARKLLRLDWRAVDEIRTRAVERGLARREAVPLEYLGLDEKSFHQGHDYVSVLTDLAGGRVWEVAEGRTEESAQRLLTSLAAPQRETVLAVALDMWPAYLNAVRDQLPEAVAVHDKFHVVKHLNEAVDHVRRVEHQDLQTRGDERLKNTRYLWLKGFAQLAPAARAGFAELKSSGLKVARAWQMKELFAEFWTFEFGADARAFFRHRHGWATRSRPAPMKKVARMLKAHLAGLLGYILHPITNAVTEGLNSKIQTLKANARGFHRFDKYRTAILFYCGKLDLRPNLNPQ